MAIEVLNEESLSHAIWAIYLVAVKGLSLAQLAWLQLIEDGVGLALEVPTGLVADAVGRKPSLLIGIVAQIAGTLLIWRAPGFTWTALGAAFIAVGDTFRSGADEALFYETHVLLTEVALYASRFGRLQAVGFGALVGLELAGARIAARLGADFVWAAEISLEVLGLATALGLVETLRRTDAASPRCETTATSATTEDGAASSSANSGIDPGPLEMRHDTPERTVATLVYVCSLTLLAGSMGTVAALVELSWAVGRGRNALTIATLSATRHLAEALGAWLAPRVTSARPAVAIAVGGALAIAGTLLATPSVIHGIVAGRTGLAAPPALAGSAVAMALVGLIQGAVGPVRSSRVNAAAPSAWRATLLSAATAAERLLRGALTLVLVSIL